MPFLPIVDILVKIVGVLGFVGVVLAFIRIGLVNRQLEDLLEAKNAKIYKLKRAVKSIYDACQNVPAPPQTDKEEILGFNDAKFSFLEASCDTFAFKEVGKVKGLRQELEKLDIAVQDAQDDLALLRQKGRKATENDVAEVASQIHEVYKLSGECDSKLSSIR